MERMFKVVSSYFQIKAFFQAEQFEIIIKFFVFWD